MSDMNLIEPGVEYFDDQTGVAAAVVEEPDVAFLDQQEEEEMPSLVDNGVEVRAYEVQNDQTIVELEQAGGFDGNRLAEILIIVVVAAIIVVGGFFLIRHFTSTSDEPKEEEQTEDIEAQPLNDGEQKPAETEAQAETTTSA